jgi:hypothetical protein
MRHHDSNHRALILRLETDPQGVKAYVKARKTIPEPDHPKAKTEGDTIFERLVEEVEKPAKRERPENSWIRPSTWSLVDQRAAMRKEGTLGRREAQYLGRKIKASIKEDRKHRAKRAGEAIMAALEEGDWREAWRILGAWHRVAGGFAAKPCYATMEKQMEGREDLYGYKSSPGEHIPANRDRAHLQDEAPPDGELRAAVKTLRNGRSGGGTNMRAEDLKRWLERAKAEEEAKRAGTEGLQGAGDTWRLFVRLVQHIWDTGEIPQKMLLTIIVLIPKGNSGDFRGIGLLEVVWKVIERVIDARMKCVLLHDALHGFRPGRSCGTGIMEVKLAQQLAGLEQCPFYGIFLDLRKAYDAMDRGRCLKILRDVGVGEKTLRLLSRFWRESVMVCRAAGFYGTLFKARRGVTQGGSLSPTIFNLMVDAIVREWERQLVEKGLGVDDVRRLFVLDYWYNLGPNMWYPQYGPKSNTYLHT